MTRRGIGTLLVLAGFALGCGETRTVPPADDAPACARIGDRCRTPDGPIGVCNDTGRSDCAEPPCLACMPQH